MLAVRRCLLAVAVAACVAIVSLFVYSQSLNKRANSLIQFTYVLSNRRDAPPTLAVLERRFGKQLKPLSDCVGSHWCGYKVTLTNEVLAALWMAPYTQLDSEFWALDGVVETSMLSYTTTVHRRYSIVVHAQTDFTKFDSFYLHPWGDSSRLDTNGMVAISSGVSSEAKQTALALNVGCLTSFAGCDTVADMLPTLWQRTADGRIIPRIRNHEGTVAGFD